MSELNDDKKILEKKARREPLEGAEASLRDQINDKLFNKLVDLNIPNKVVKMWEAEMARKSTWLTRQQAYLSNWDEHTLSDTNGPFDGSSSLHIPVTFTVAKTVHARFNQAIWQDPPCNTKARNEASTDRIPVVQDTLRYNFIDWCNYNKGAEEVVDEWIWDWVTVGSAIQKMSWECAYTRFIDVVTVQEQGPSKFIVGPDGKEREQPQLRLVEKEIAVTKKTFEGMVYRNVDHEDIVIVGGKGDIDAADAVLERDFLTSSYLWTQADRKIFKADAVRKIIDSGPDYVNGSTGSDIKSQRAQNAGTGQVDSEYDLDRYEIIEAYLKVDVDGSGINSDVVAWVHKKSRTLLRATFLYRISPSGERPYAKADFYKRKGQEYGVGLPELLYPLSVEMDAIHNMRLDYGMVSTMPFGFYKPTSGIDPETIQLEPGALIPVDNPQTDVYFPQLGNRTVFGFQEEAAIQQMIERLTSISDMSLGVVGAQGATRTATGSRILNNEMSANLDIHLRRLNRGWKKVLRYTLHTLQKRIPAGLSFRVTGEDGKDYWRQVKSADAIAGDYDLEVSPNSSSSNEGIQQEKAQQIMQIVSDPLAIQLGAVNANGYYEAKKNLLQSFGVRDFGRYLSKPAAVTRIYTPEEEANRLLRGMPVPLSPEMDHEGFINYFQEIVDNDDLLGQFTEEQTIVLAKQAKAHEEMMKALEQMQAQKANAQQMQQNAAMSQQQAPTGMSPQAQPTQQGGGSV